MVSPSERDPSSLPDAPPRPVGASPASRAGLSGRLSHAPASSSPPSGDAIPPASSPIERSDVGSVVSLHAEQARLTQAIEATAPSVRATRNEVGRGAATLTGIRVSSRPADLDRRRGRLSLRQRAALFKLNLHALVTLATVIVRLASRRQQLLQLMGVARTPCHDAAPALIVATGLVRGETVTARDRARVGATFAAFRVLPACLRQQQPRQHQPRHSTGCKKHSGSYSKQQHRERLYDTHGGYRQMGPLHGGPTNTDDPACSADIEASTVLHASRDLAESSLFSDISRGPTLRRNDGDTHRTRRIFRTVRYRWTHAARGGGARR